MSQILLSLTAFLALTGSAFAASFDLQDPAILGRYTLAPPNQLSNIQTAEIRYDADGNLTLNLAHTKDTFVLKETAPNDYIVGGTSDTSCEDCHEDTATGDKIQVRLVKGAQNRPQLLVEVTWGDTLDEDEKNGQTVTYTLDWTAAIPNAQSFYLNSDNSEALQTVLERCTSSVAPAVTDSGTITSESDVCPSVTTVKFRSTIEQALPWYLKETNSSKGTQEISLTDLKAALDREESFFAKIPSKEIKIKPSQVAGAFHKVTDYFLKSTDRAYARKSESITSYFLVNSKEQTILTFDLTNR